MTIVRLGHTTRPDQAQAQARFVGRATTRGAALLTTVPAAAVLARAAGLHRTTVTDRTPSAITLQLHDFAGTVRAQFLTVRAEPIAGCTCVTFQLGRGLGLVDGVLVPDGLVPIQSLVWSITQADPDWRPLETPAPLRRRG